MRIGLCRIIERTITNHKESILDDGLESVASPQVNPSLFGSWLTFRKTKAAVDQTIPLQAEVFERN